MSHSGWMRLRRPAEIVEATRWLFAVLTLVTLVLALPALRSAVSSTLLLVGVVSFVGLAVSISAGYLCRSAPWWTDPIDVLALLGIALAAPDPMVVVGLVIPALWFRSLYGSIGRALLRAGLYAVAVGASLPLWAQIPGHTGGSKAGVVMSGVVPSIFLTVTASRQLAGSLRAREQATQRDAVHKSAGSQLLGVTDAVEIRQIAWTAMAGICSATPGLRVLKVVREGSVLRVDRATEGFANLPATIPAAVLLLRGDDEFGIVAVQRFAELDAAAGIACGWDCVPLPCVHNQQGGGWLILGSPRKVRPEAITAVGTLANQVTLALRSAEVHHELTVQATLDGLTRLANRATFNIALAAALDDNDVQQTTVLFVDIDDFKDVNDRFGHAAGDDLLREVAARLHRATRPGDLCARLGGDEFAVLLGGTSGAAGAVVAQRIVEAMAVAAHLGGGTAHVGASVGVATATGEADLERLIHRADVAMYAAKAQGKSRVQVFEPALLQGDSSQVAFEEQLLSAAENGELIVHYQPVLSLPGGRCTAVEALVRWQHPDRGLLYPEAFIEAAERIGAISDIGAYVLRRACADTAAWRDAYPSSPLAIHVNISALQLDDDGFIDSVVRCLGDFTLDPDQLVLEVTETEVIASPMVIDQLNTLAGLGVMIAIDDFGTGYSALTTLRSLPAKIVKIDTSFVAGSLENPQDRAVTEAVVKMAAQMGMRTIAEGVERPEQEAFLETIGANAVQGFLYLRPTTAGAFGAWLDLHLKGQTRHPPSGNNIVIPFPPRHSA